MCVCVCICRFVYVKKYNIYHAPAIFLLFVILVMGNMGKVLLLNRNSNYIHHDCICKSENMIIENNNKKSSHCRYKGKLHKTENSLLKLLT